MTTELRHNPPLNLYFVNSKGKLRTVEIVQQDHIYSYTDTRSAYLTSSLGATKAEAIAYRLSKLQADLGAAQKAKEDAEVKIDCLGIAIDKVKALEIDK